MSLNSLNSYKKGFRLRGKRVLLSAATLEDSMDIVRWRNMPGIRKAFISGGKLTRAKQALWFKSYMKKPLELQLMIKAGTANIGTLAVYGIDPKNANCEIGRIMIGETEYRGKGYAREALSLLLSFAFKTLKMYRVSLEVIETNVAAANLYKSLGFRVEGVERGRVRRNGKRINVLLMSILRSEFR